MGESCYSLALVSEDGMLLNSTMLMLEDEKMQNLCNTSEEKFVCHYYDEQSSIMQEREIFLIGDRIGPISVKGHTYHYLIASLTVIMRKGTAMSLIRRAIISSMSTETIRHTAYPIFTRRWRTACSKVI